MSRFGQRLETRLRDEEFAAPYRDMEAELTLVQAIESVRSVLCTRAPSGRPSL